MGIPALRGNPARSQFVSASGEFIGLRSNHDPFCDGFYPFITAAQYDIHPA